MSNIPVLFAKLAGLRKVLPMWTSNEEKPLRNPQSVLPYFEQYAKIRDELISVLPDLYSDLVVRKIPEPAEKKEGYFGGQGYIHKSIIEQLIGDLDYIFEVRANSRIGEEIVVIKEKERRIFISHGRSKDWLEVQAYIEKDIKIQTLELAQEPNKGRTVLQKLTEEADRCSYAVIVMTGDDDLGEGSPRVRENVMHEIGFFQGKYGLQNVTLLYEEDTNIPSNIHGLVYIPFPKGYVHATFGALQREISAAFQA